MVAASNAAGTSAIGANSRNHQQRLNRKCSQTSAIAAAEIKTNPTAKCAVARLIGTDATGMINGTIAATTARIPKTTEQRRRPSNVSGEDVDLACMRGIAPH